MGFIKDGNHYDYEQFLSGTGHRTMELLVPSGKKVARGDAVNETCDLSDGTDLFGIVLETADGTSAATKTTVVVSGAVIYEGLNVKDSTDKAAFITKARDKGIIVKELGGIN